MADQKNNSNKSLWMLGLAMTLPMILLSGPLAGYFLGYLFVKKLGWASWLMPVLIGFGFLGSAVQCFQLIQKIKETEDQQKK